MKTPKTLLTLILCVLALATVAPSVKAQNPITFHFTGVITSVDDSLGWFQNTYAVGAAVTGSYTFLTPAMRTLDSRRSRTTTHSTPISLTPTGSARP